MNDILTVIFCITSGLDKDDELTEEMKARPHVPFLAKFIELQGLMIHHNSALTQSHPYASSPITWPFVIRGISFWEKKDGLKQIYLMGHPTTWILSILGLTIYVMMWILDRFFLHRGYDDWGPNCRRWWDRSLGFLFIAWVLHYIPFFLMGRMLFLHHYLPAYIITVIMMATLFDYLGRQPLTPSMNKVLRMHEWHEGQGNIIFHSFCVILISVSIYFYVYFMPLTYGTGFDSLEMLRARKWFKSWDLQHA